MNTVDVSDYLEKQHSLGIESYNKHDWDTFSRGFSENAVIIRGNGDTVEGRETIKAYYSQMHELVDLKFNVTSRESSGNLCYETVEYTFKSGTEGKAVTVQSLQVSKQQADGKWRIQAISYSSPSAKLH